MTYRAHCSGKRLAQERKRLHALRKLDAPLSAEAASQLDQAIASARAHIASAHRRRVRASAEWALGEFAHTLGKLAGH